MMPDEKELEFLDPDPLVDEPLKTDRPDFSI